MAALAKAGLSPTDAKLVLHYENTAEYVEAMLKVRERERIELAKTIAQAVRVAMHGNKDSYLAFTGSIERALREMDEDDEKPTGTVFDKLKAGRKKTVFDRLKGLKR